MPRVIVLDDLAEAGLDLLRNESEIDFDVRTGLAGAELREALQGYDAAICRSGVKITADALKGNTSIKAIVRAGVGTDNIDKPSATRAGIVVMNTPTGNSVSTAEHTFALMLALSRNLAPAFASLKEGRWDRKKFSGNQLAGKTLGVVGLGRIGQEVARRAKAFDMQVIGYDPFFPEQESEKIGIARVAEVEEMLPRVDYLTVHTPLTDQTRGMIGTKEIDMMKPSVRLINCARGGIYDEAAIAEGLAKGKIAGVSLDVYEKEPCIDSPLFQMEGVLCTPHLGASTAEAQTSVAVEAVLLTINFLTTGEVRHAVNVAPLDPKVLEAMRGNLDVAYRLGILVGNWHGGGIEQCQLELHGHVADQDARLIQSAVCAGLLQGRVDQEVNIINAETFCRERGIQLSCESSSDMRTFSSSIHLTVSGHNKTRTAAGTVFGTNMPRLIRMNDYRLDAYLDGHLLIFCHRDVPGVIGNIGTTLGKQNVNIAQMAVGRAEDLSGGEAIGVLNLDAEVDPETIIKAGDFEGIESVEFVKLPGRFELPSWLA